jgi:hypothetical protein
MNSGRARGGPYNTKMIHHHGPVYRLAVVASEDWLRALPGQCGPTENEPDVVFGSYVFQLVWRNDLGQTQRQPVPRDGEKLKNRHNRRIACRNRGLYSLVLETVHLSKGGDLIFSKAPAPRESTPDRGRCDRAG